MNGVRYVSWAGRGGYETAAQGYLRALVHAGLPVEWVPLFPRIGGWSPAGSVAEARDRVGVLEDPRDPEHGDYGTWARQLIGHHVEPSTKVLHTIPETWSAHVGSGERMIGNTVWETDRLPHHWPDLLNEVDQIIVPSQFNAEVFGRAGLDPPIAVVPHIRVCEPATADDETVASFRRRHGIEPGNRVVYCVDAWNPRKAPWTTINTFLRAFNSRDPVTLVFKTSAYGPRSAVDPAESRTRDLVAELVASVRDPAEVVVITEQIAAADLEILHQIGDCYLSMSHGEGFGVGPFEAAAAGNPVVVAGWGGTLDYLTRVWPFLLDIELVPVMNVQGLPSYDAGQRWASPDCDQALEFLRDVVTDPVSARGHISAIAARIRHDFSVEAVAPRLVAAIT